MSRLPLTAVRTSRSPGNRGARRRRGAARLARSLGAVSACALSGLVATAAPAGAYVLHDFEAPAISEVPAGGGVTAPGVLAETSAMTAVGGRLWVDENDASHQARVDAFDPVTRGFLQQLPSPPEVEQFHYGVAVAAPGGHEQVLVGGIGTAGGDSGDGTVSVYCLASSSWCGTWTGADTVEGTFGSEGVKGLAVDRSTNSMVDWAAGDVYVADIRSGRVYVFAPQESGAESAPVATIEGSLSGVPDSQWLPLYVAVDEANGDVVVAAKVEVSSSVYASVVDVFEPTVFGSYGFVGSIAGPAGRGFDAITGVAVDGAAGDIYVSEHSEHQEGGSGASVVDEFGLSGLAYLGHIVGTGEEGQQGKFDIPRLVAVDPGVSPRLFVGDERKLQGSAAYASVIDAFGPDVVVPDVLALPASGVGALGATLNGEVNALEGETHGAAKCRFEWGTSEALGETTSCEHEVTGSSPVGVSVTLGGSGSGVKLESDTKYYYRLTASDRDGVDPGEEPTAQCEGVVSSFACFMTLGPGLHGGSWSTGVSSDSATLEAEIDPHGVETSYFFQYGTTSAYGEQTVQAPAGSGEGEVKGSALLERLAAGTVYHYRVVAVSEVAGRVEQFPGPDHTFTTRPLAGGTLGLPDGREYELVSPADKHGGYIYPLNGGDSDSIQAAADGGGISYGTQSPVAVGTRGYPRDEQELSTRGPDGGWCTVNLSSAQSEATGLATLHPEFLLFSSDLSSGMVEQPGEVGALLSEEASERTPYLWSGGDCRESTVPRFEPFVTGKAPWSDVPAGTHFGRAPGVVEDWARGASPDMRHVIVLSQAQLTSVDTHGHEELYEWSAQAPYKERLRLISVLPGGEPSSLPDINLGADVGLDFASDGPHEVSDDGSRIYWTDNAGLYLYDTVTGKSIEIKGGGAKFQWASPSVEGPERVSHVLFTEAGELYECEIVQRGGEDECELTDITPPHGAEDAEVQKAILGYGEGEFGSFVYFVADGTLGQPGAVPGECLENDVVPLSAACNLFVYHDGRVHLIAVLSQADKFDWIGDRTTPDQLGDQTAGVSPDGRFLAFMSRGSLTGYDNVDAVTGQPDQEVFLYDGASEKLVCASCDPTGQRPVGASSIPGWTDIGPFEEALYRSRYLDNSGRLFFDSDDALLPQDVNGATDVYEYEPPGLGSCDTGAGTYSPRSEGCLGLISSGSGQSESTFMDASESGDDVFFRTAAKLVGADTDSAFDIYDAHVCTAESPCASEPAPPPAACESAAECRAAPSPQPGVFGAPASATFTGPGNTTPPPPPPSVAGGPAPKKAAKKSAKCKKGFVKKHSKCVKQPKKPKRAKRAKQADHKGRK